MRYYCPNSNAFNPEMELVRATNPHYLTPSQPLLSLDLYCRNVVVVRASGNVVCCEVILENQVMRDSDSGRRASSRNLGQAFLKDSVQVGPTCTMW